MLRLHFVALLVTVTVLVSGCGADDAVDGADAVTTSPSTAPTTDPVTTTTAPTTTTTRPPPTIIVAGDSIFYDVSPALEAALDPMVADVVPLIVPSIAAESSRETLLRRVDESNPELVVVAVGVWERAYQASNGAALGDPGFAETYSVEVLDPVRERIEAAGGHLIVMGPPKVWEESTNVQFGELEMIWGSYAALHPSVDFLDSDIWVSEAGTFVEFDETGPTTARLRRTDRVHLCAEGARRVASGLIAEFATRLDIDGSATAAGWEEAAWTDRFPADECPPV
ncbi:MAG: hypothetical protein ACSLFO_09060 [Acidimicrobiales bacterium]